MAAHIRPVAAPRSRGSPRRPAISCSAPGARGFRRCPGRTGDRRGRRRHAGRGAGGGARPARERAAPGQRWSSPTRAPARTAGGLPGWDAAGAGSTESWPTTRRPPARCWTRTSSGWAVGEVPPARSPRGRGTRRGAARCAPARRGRRRDQRGGRRPRLDHDQRRARSRALPRWLGGAPRGPRLVADAIVDQHFAERRREGRLDSALRGGARRGFDSELAPCSTDEARVIGASAVFLRRFGVDAGALQGGPGSPGGPRVTLARPGQTCLLGSAHVGTRGSTRR